MLKTSMLNHQKIVTTGETRERERMDWLSRTVSSLEPSATMAMGEKIRILHSHGRDIISMATGESDFPTHDHIKAAAVKAIEQNKTRYTSVAGIVELREAIVAFFKTHYDLQYQPEDVIVSCGAKQVLYNALVATLNPGDEVVIPAPYWVSYPSMVKMCGGKAVIAQTLDTDGFCLTPDILQEALTSSTKWLLFNMPSNPSGVLYPRKKMLELAEVLEAFPAVHIMSDDIYQPIIYEGEFTSIAQLSPALFARTLTVHGVSKGWNMTGWRVGFGAGSSDLIKAMVKVQGQSTAHACSISQWAALAALSLPPDTYDQERDTLRKRRDILCDHIDSIEGLACHKPQGAFYVFVDCRSFLGKISAGGANINSDEDFAMALLEENDLACVPGHAFGCNGYVRLSYTIKTSMLQEACERLKTFCRGCKT